MTLQEIHERTAAAYARSLRTGDGRDAMWLALLDEQAEAIAEQQTTETNGA